MVIEVNSENELNEFASRKRLVLVAMIRGVDQDKKRYVTKLLSIIEEESEPTIYTAIYTQQGEVLGRPFIEISLYLDGSQVFSQEGVFEDLESDLEALKNGIRETLRSKAIRVRFVKKG
ncbi:MAG: hypothetical protein JHC33_00015 [Ignisphaera sp.]|nr:hypothetical protein [Ignisphaera sp.]